LQDLLPIALQGRRLVNRAALTDADLQACYWRLYVTYANLTVPSCVGDAETGLICTHPLFDPTLLSQPPPETVPTLVQIYNTLLPTQVGLT
jgi:hypothetical protein